MTTLYLIRHGQTDNNIYGGFNGTRSNQPLNATGRKMAAALTPAFADIPLDAIYTSPLKRAMATAEGVRGGRQIPMIIDPDIREIDFGVWDGTAYLDSKRKYPQEMRRWHRDLAHFIAPGGSESAHDVSVRMFRAVLRILRAHRGGTVALVSHGCALDFWLTHALGMPIQSFHKIAGLYNTAYGVVEIEDDGHFTVKEWNKREHYHPEEVLPSRHRRARRMMRAVVGTRRFHPAFQIQQKGKKCECKQTLKQ